MKGDFTRDTFDAKKHFSRVLMQQGRVQLDADWNEQAAILLHYLRTLAADLIGDHGGPGDGFKIQGGSEFDLLITKGRYYVDGILCEAEEDVAYSSQPDHPLREGEQLVGKKWYLVYLDAWERHITHIEDVQVDSRDGSVRVEDGSIREVALGGPDTATRAKVVWQVKTWDVPSGTLCNTLNWAALKEEWQPADRGRLKARAKATEEMSLDDPCILSPDAQYRGAENQLYRVEIHNPGDGATATFKWSRDNGTVVFAISEKEATTSKPGPNSNLVTDTTIVYLERLSQDARSGLSIGDWVEIVDDDYVLQRRAEPLWKVDAIDPVERQVSLRRVRPGLAVVSDVGQSPAKHPLLRRWDHKTAKGAPVDQDTIPLIEEEWLELEDGVQIVLGEPEDGSNRYRTGDYWLIPARTATGDVEWPKDINGQPRYQGPDGVEHHYAPLAIVHAQEDGTVQVRNHCRQHFRNVRDLTVAVA